MQFFANSFKVRAKSTINKFVQGFFLFNANQATPSLPKSVFKVLDMSFQGEIF